MIADKVYAVSCLSARYIPPLARSRVTRRGIADNPLTYSGQINCLLLLSCRYIRLRYLLLNMGCPRINERVFSDGYYRTKMNGGSFNSEELITNYSRFEIKGF